LPAFTVKAVAFFGNRVTDRNYIDSRDIIGKMEDVYRQCISFMSNNIRHVQGDQDFNSLGILEIPLSALQELMVNALIHRDYLIASPIRLIVFQDRIEIISPGHLPNTLSIESIRLGTSTMRNSVLSSFAIHILPYRGIGSGIKHALKEYPHITFEDDRIGNQFKAIIARQSIAGN
jgi:ATP-dependent DNA helicase RecG